MICNVKTIYDSIDRLAPFELAYDWDNVGLLCGDFRSDVHCILVALDVCAPVIEEAERVGAHCIVTHHPILFRPIQRIDVSSHDGALVYGLIKAGISHIAAHTNLDIAEGGVNDALIKTLGLTADFSRGHMRFGIVEETNLDEINRRVGSRLVCDPCVYGNRAGTIRRFAVSSGSAGGEEIHEALINGADVLITGEMKYHDLLEAMDSGLNVICAGHAHTERCAVEVLANHLQSDLNALKFTVRVVQSCIYGYGGIR